MKSVLAFIFVVIVLIGCSGGRGLAPIGAQFAPVPVLDPKTPVSETCNGELTVVVKPVVSQVPVNEDVVWNVKASGCTGIYRIQGTSDLFNPSRTFARTYATEGQKTETVTVESINLKGDVFSKTVVSAPVSIVAAGEFFCRVVNTSSPTVEAVVDANNNFSQSLPTFNFRIETPVNARVTVVSAQPDGEVSILPTISQMAASAPSTAINVQATLNVLGNTIVGFVVTSSVAGQPTQTAGCVNTVTVVPKQPAAPAPTPPAAAPAFITNGLVYPVASPPYVYPFDNNPAYTPTAASDPAKFGSGIAVDPFAIGFDGQLSQWSVANGVAPAPAAVTVCSWVRFNQLDQNRTCGSASAGTQYIAFERNNRLTGFEGYALLKTSFNTFQFVISSSAGTQGIANSTTVASAGDWYHVCGTFSQPTVKIYVNGVERGSRTHDFPISYGQRDLFLGRSGECNPNQCVGKTCNPATEVANHDGFFYGSMAHMSIYNRALSAAEILQNCFAHRGKYQGAACQ